MEIVTRTRGRAKNPYLKQVGSNMEMKIVTRTRPIMKIAGKKLISSMTIVSLVMQ